eukprot:12994283-Ditylum_brightwellii.AAC.1
MICKRHDQDAPRIEMDPQLSFHADGGDPQDGEEEVLPPTGGGKVRPWVTCDKCKKKGHYVNKCPVKEVKLAVLAFGIEGSNNKGYNSNSNNKFIFLTNKHHRVNKNYLLLDNQSSTNIMCNRKYITNIRKVNKTLTLNYFEHST